MGSKKSVEIHMMDRHLIYPPGWEKRQKNDWDADPSLKGKPVPIPGTGLTLDTPEALDAWLAERKKRWPSASKVEEKKRKVEEAIERGQLDPSLSLDGRKKRRLDDGGGGRGRVRGRGRGRGDSGWGRGRGRGGASVPATREPNVSGPLPPAGLPPKPVTVQDSNPTDSDSDSDDAPEAVSFKPPAGLLDSYASSEDEESKAREPVDAEPDPPIPAMTQQPPVTEPPAKPVRKPFVPQPKKPPNNPFGSRPSLLRRLLLPEIRVTVSNFSQAIHFLVENDFLENVEMKPGQASEKMIEVIGESNIADHTSGGAEKLDDA
ncbi:hypothetical protein GLOTRDRAFT_118856 [Gloeophyllum trabeum ATCC 11539]|uniref:FMR1-interacting protein 1 conserved domain-containing protein n=1 Tax=Gloeophyllum trabeum (strain ATCC 11539 / FP-39264 / Madison 617) TaxID=670483 RepID=S7S048_GLOTA|nr:uncharacterized protein GLOTRDRAFT_118856 [Gloeophyllum trabeum ATCC 11539]EPQ60715.1 hypothetical protein GLOTRDRAFT_118856 [Gloeophyllum trabeum ATCC 11539]